MQRLQGAPCRLVAAACLCAAAGLAGSIPVWGQPVAPPDVAAAPDDAEVLSSGLAWRQLAPGSGEERPRSGDWVTIHYDAWTTEGERFDSSVARGEPVRVVLERLPAGVQQGLALMVAGEKRRLWIPPELAYAGQRGRPQGTVVFDLELVEIVRVPEAPPNVAAPPAGAESAKGGLMTQMLVAGEGGRRPKTRDTVVVHYTGWTTEGEMFDSSVLRGKPSTFRLDQVIRGWTVGLQLMVEGEKRRLWIPAKMAYKGVEGRPQGMLVFDVELLDIQ